MDSRTRLRFELIAAYAGVVFVPTYPVAWAWIGKAQPPLSFGVTAQQAADFYLSNSHRIALGMAAAAIIGGLWIPWTGQLTTVLRRIEGPESSTFTTTQVVGGVLTAWAFIGTPVIWLLPAFRQDADPQVIRSFSDFAYLTFNATFIISTMQAVAAGMLALADRRARPVFPRWAGWLAIVCGLSFAVVGLTPFVSSGGPFSLEGWFAGWIPGSLFFVWTAVTTYYMVKDARYRLREYAHPEMARVSEGV
jgi:hypothetical protein